MARHQAWLAFVVIGTATLTGPLDTAVNIAFPNITTAFEISIASIQWVIICYVLTFASLTLIFGRLADIVGHLKIFRLGLLVSAFAFIGCGAATQFEWLLLFRVSQGVGAAMVISCGPALVTAAFDETARPKALGGYTMILGLGGAIGPSLGGIMVDAWDWPAVFWFRFPLAVGALALTFLVSIPPPPRAAGRFDLRGALLLAIALGSLLLGLNALSKYAWTWAGLATLCAGLLFTGYVWHQRRLETPLLRLSWFRDPDFALLNTATIVVNAVAFSVWLLVPYFLVRSAELSLIVGGLVLACGPIGMMAAGQAGGFFIQRIGANRVAGAGALIIGMGIYAVSLWQPPQVSLTFMIASLLLHGVGLGLFQVASLDFIIARLPRVDRGVAGSLAMVNRTFGLVFGASLLTLLFVFLQDVHGAQQAAFLPAFQDTFLYASCLLFAFLLVTLAPRRFWLRKLTGP